MFKKRTKKEVLSFLRSHPIMSIAVIGKNKKPISSIVLFTVDNDLTFYFATGSKSYKAKALIANPEISFSVWDFDSLLIQADGRATVLNKESSIDIALDKLTDSTSKLQEFWPPLLGIWKNDYLVFKVKLNWLRVLDHSHTHIKEKKPAFTEFNF